MMIGIDEAGRGSWAGPLVVGAVRLKSEIAGLDDSKKLSPAKRQSLYQAIIRLADYGVGWVSAEEVDLYGMTKSTELGITRSLSGFDRPEISDIVIDGNYNYLNSDDWPMSRCQIKADQSEPCVMAASIIAKVSRDNHMLELTKQYPDYGFDKHKGYGTSRHLLAIKKYGLSKEHRRSFNIKT